MSHRLTTEEFIEKACIVHNDKYDYSETEYINSRTDVVIKCCEHGLFMQRPDSHLQGNGCPKCAIKIRVNSNAYMSRGLSRRYTTDEFIEKSHEVHGNKYDYSETVYINSRTNVKIICPVHGEFYQNPVSHLSGHGCKRCGDKSAWSGQAGELRKAKVITPERQLKSEATCFARYGAKTYALSSEGRKHINEIRNTDEYRQKMHNIISSDVVQQKILQTNMDRYGVKSPMQLESVKQAVYDAKRSNHTFNISSSEESMYDILVSYYGNDDVLRQYKSDKYPYACDFYIKSQDLYIELNASWTHGGHWFDSTSSSDIEQLNEWIEKSKTSDYYKNAINVWTKYDVMKRMTALSNHLNYLVFWDSKLVDFLEWIDLKRRQ